MTVADLEDYYLDFEIVDELGRRGRVATSNMLQDYAIKLQESSFVNFHSNQQNMVIKTLIKYGILKNAEDDVVDAMNRPITNESPANFFNYSMPENEFENIIQR